MLVPHEGTWTSSPVCYLEDLYVEDGQRGGGLGRKLLDGCLDLARERGWSRFYWHTNADNHRARRLYDSYLPADDNVRYRASPLSSDRRMSPQMVRLTLSAVGRW